MAKQVDKKFQQLLEQFKQSESSASIVFGAIVLIVAGILIYNFNSSNREMRLLPEGQATESATPSNSLMTARSYVVQANDTLWSIAERKYGSGYNYVDIAKENNLQSEARLHVGTSLVLPDVPVRRLDSQASHATTTSSEPTIIAEGSPITGNTYVVVHGDSLWNIALRAYGDGYKWKAIYEANKHLIQNPDIIYTEWTIALPR